MRKLSILVLVLAFSFITACSGNQGPISTPFVGGQTALLLSFSPSSPPDTIFDDQQFPFTVTIDVENRGEYSLEAGDGYIELEGINGATFGVSESDLMEDIPAIDGTRKNYDGSVSYGSRDVVSFATLNYQENLIGDFPITLRASACYNYQTKTTTNICIKKDSIDDLQEREICRISDARSVQNSGGPIHITKLTQVPQGRQGIQVVFVIEHVGSTNAFFYREDAVCDTRVNNPEKYQVYVDVLPIVRGSIHARCSGFQEGSGSAGYVTLFQGNPRTVTCTFDTTSINRDFIEPLNINLKYRYQHFIQKQIIVKDVTTNRR